MNVLIVSHLALPHVGGVENLVDLEIRALLEEGHQVTLVTSDGTGAGRNPDYGPNVRIIRCQASHFLEHKLGIPYPLFSPGLLLTLYREVQNSDVVHVHGFMFLSTVVALAWARLLGKPSLMTDHGGIQKFGSKPATLAARLGAETLGRLSASLARRNITYNARIQQTLNHLARRKDAEFLPNPVDGTLFSPPTPEERTRARTALGWTEDRKKVLFVGRLIATKGVPLVVAASDASYDLVFCGPGDVSLLGTLPRPGIEYLPPRPQQELRQLYQAGDLLVLPAEVREGFPLVVQEAVASGLPVVLGYDPGFEPYRLLPNLTFCTRDVESVRTAIRQALVAPRETHPHFFPARPEWIRQLYRFPASAASSESRAV
jgi:glycosyltransferase involved in cell wall biosynthesis